MHKFRNYVVNCAILAGLAWAVGNMFVQGYHSGSGILRQGFVGWWEPDGIFEGLIGIVAMVGSITGTSLIIFMLYLLGCLEWRKRRTTHDTSD